MAVAHRIGEGVDRVAAGRRRVDGRGVASRVAVGVVAVDRQRAIGPDQGHPNRTTRKRGHRQTVAVRIRVPRAHRAGRRVLEHVDSMRGQHRCAVDGEVQRLRRRAAHAVAHRIGERVDRMAARRRRVDG